MGWGWGGGEYQSRRRGNADRLPRPEHVVEDVVPSLLRRQEERLHELSLDPFQLMDAVASDLHTQTRGQ